jgi:hypothetical protein
MKTRLGFVSNSSSSSFIVAVKKNSKPIGTITKTITVDLNNYASEPIKSVEDLYEYFRENYGDKEDWYEDILKSYKLALKEIANGKDILVGEFGDQDDFEERILCETGLQTLQSDTVTVIQSEAGY